MPQPARRNASDQMMMQLIEADVDIGFGLVDEARAYRFSGQSEFSVRALQNAEEIVADIEKRLERLGEEAAVPFLPLVQELRREISSVSRESGEGSAA